MVGWQTMDTGESWLDGLDWTSVEVGEHASHKAGTGSLAHSLDGFLLPAEQIVAEGRAVVLANLDAAGLLLVTNFRLLFLVSFIWLWTMLLLDLSFLLTWIMPNFSTLWDSFGQCHSLGDNDVPSF
jgi:hypothetical protein